MARRDGARELVLRTGVLLAGLAVMALGVALTVRALIGTTPISALPVVLAEGLPWSVGAFTVALNVVLVLFQIVLLRRRFEWIQLLQIPIASVFGAMCDVWLWALRDLQPEGYGWQLALSLLGSIVLGVGVWIEVVPRTVTLAGEGAVNAIVRVTGWSFGSVKIGVDSTLVAIAVVVSFALLGELHGVREGTVIGAVLVGWTVKRLMRRFPAVAARFAPPPVPPSE